MNSFHALATDEKSFLFFSLVDWLNDLQEKRLAETEPDFQPLTPSARYLLREKRTVTKACLHNLSFDSLCLRVKGHLLFNSKFEKLKL